MKKTSHTVMFKPTCDCNLNCKYCYDKPMRERFAGIKSDTKILRHTVKLLNNYSTEVQWYWHGGEPTLMGHDYYYNAQEIFAENHDTLFLQALQTNGILPLTDDNWIQTALDCSIGMGFSFDLYGQSSRLNSEVDITDKFEDMLEKFKDSGARDCIETVTVITNKTIGSLIETYEHFKTRFGAEYIMSLLLVFEIDESNPSGLGITEEDYIKHYPEYLNHLLNDCSPNALVDRYIYSYLMRLIGRPETTLCGFIDCREKWLAVNPDGSVMHCDREPGTHYGLGNIMDYDSIEDIYSSDAYTLFKDDCQERIDNYCKKCNFYGLCVGGCPANHGSVNKTKVNKVNPRECYTIQHNIISVYSILQDIRVGGIYNRKLVEMLSEYRVNLPQEIHLYLESKGLHYDYVVNTDMCHELPETFTEQLGYKVFKIFNTGTPTSIEEIYDKNRKILGEILHAY